jgi:hypothetical protein
MADTETVTEADVGDLIVGEDGELHEVVPVKAVAAMTAVSELHGGRSELPSNASKIIEQAMASAASQAIEEHGHDAEKIKAAMLQARDSTRKALRNEMNEFWSRRQAEQ